MAFTPDIIIYHDPCDDGFASAYVAHQRFPAAALFGTNYGKPLPVEKVKGKAVLIVDFSYPLDILKGIAPLCNGIVILDHHKTAAEALADVPRLDPTLAPQVIMAPGEFCAWFNQERAGVGLTWRFCFPDEPMPAVLEAIEDRDLWRFTHDTTEEVCAAVRSFPHDIEVWRREVMPPDRFPALATEGQAILRYVHHLANEVASNCHFRSWPADWAGVPVVCCPPQIASEVCHRLLALYPSAPFVAAFVEADGIRSWSLRSEDKRTDVSMVARKHGGGGHRNAAGFTALC
jgi:oligoribonuclease NrnB/cAMP/cGMP phosphodiesterase (DHH superfamily)